MSAQIPLTFTNAIAGEREKPEYAMRRGVTARPLIDVPRAANADPHTSHLAAERIKASGALNEQQHLVLAYVKRFPGMTSAELAEQRAKEIGGTWREHRPMFGRRLGELAVFHIRKGEARVCRVCKAKCVTWWPKQSTGSER